MLITSEEDRQAVATFLRSIARVLGHDGGVTVILHPLEPARDMPLAVFSSLNRRAQARIVYLEAIVQSLIADGATPENAFAIAIADAERVYGPGATGG